VAAVSVVLAAGLTARLPGPTDGGVGRLTGLSRDQLSALAPRVADAFQIAFAVPAGLMATAGIVAVAVFRTAQRNQPVEPASVGAVAAPGRDEVGRRPRRDNRERCCQPVPTSRSVAGEPAQGRARLPRARRCQAAEGAGSAVTSAGDAGCCRASSRADHRRARVEPLAGTSPGGASS
jgi:hypothetical protein